MGKHTPGPWRYSHSEDDKLQVLTEQDRTICTITFCQPTDMQKANARLIAAAPELLQLAKTILAYIDDEHEGTTSDIREAVRRTIARAEGRTA